MTTPTDFLEPARRAIADRVRQSLNLKYYGGNGQNEIGKSRGARVPEILRLIFKLFHNFKHLTAVKLATSDRVDRSTALTNVLTSVNQTAHQVTR
jgi:hypothetical protein